MFWTSIVATLFILIDGLVKQIGGKSLFGDFHWVALRVLDLLLCISVFFYSRKLENLLDMKEKIFQVKKDWPRQVIFLATLVVF